MFVQCFELNADLASGSVVNDRMPPDLSRQYGYDDE